MAKLGKYLANPLAFVVFLGARQLLNWLPDRTYLRLYYRGRTGQRLNLNRPQTFNEKLQWLKLHDRDPRYTVLVDKYLVKEVVASILGSRAIVPTLGHWGNASEIDFSKLPNQFVLKANHNSGGVIICRDKQSFDMRQAVRSLNSQLRRSYFWASREWPYRNVEPLVFAERYLPDEQSVVESATNYSGARKFGVSDIRGIVDYKFYCFHGEPQFLYVSKGFENHSTTRVAFLSLDWKPLGFGRSDYANFEQLPNRPKTLTEMIETARLLSANIPFVRVDLFEHEGVVLFSELTFHPVSGMMPFVPREADAQVGSLLHLDRVRATV